MTPISLTVNGQTVQALVEPRSPKFGDSSTVTKLRVILTQLCSVCTGARTSFRTIRISGFA